MEKISKKIITTIRLDKDLKEMLNYLATDRGIPASYVIRNGVLEYIKNHNLLTSDVDSKTG